MAMVRKRIEICIQFLFIFFISAVLIGGDKGDKMIESLVQEKTIPYATKDFSHLLGMEGFSDQLLRNHFKLYEGYVKNTNEIAEMLAHMSPQVKPSIEYSELNRRFGFEFSGMRLHEYYFGNLIKGGKAPDKNSLLLTKIKEDFGRFDTWKQHFCGMGMMRGIGWVVLYFDPTNHSLHNVWIDEHQVNNLPGCEPILVMDVWEHAFMLDYQLDKSKYIDAFMKNVNWEEANRRLAAASHSKQ